MSVSDEDEEMRNEAAMGRRSVALLMGTRMRVVNICQRAKEQATSTIEASRTRKRALAAPPALSEQQYKS